MINNIQYNIVYSDWFIFNLIEQIQSPLNLYNLKLTCKFYFKEITFANIKYVVVKNITKRLINCSDINYNNLISYMGQYNVYISGSFILQCIMDEYWDNSDIDLYTNENIYLDENIIYNENYEINKYDNNDGYFRLYGITNVNNYITTKNKTHIQLIKLGKNINIIDYIKTTYDFNICKNIYSVKNGKHILYIDNLQNIMNKIVTGGILGTAHKFPDRKQKYINRGFTFQNNFVGNHIYYNGRIIPIIIYDKRNDKIKLFNKTFAYDGYTKSEFIFTINNNDYVCSIDNMKQIKKYKCSFWWANCSNRNKVPRGCALRCLNNTFEHYHIKLFVTNKYDCGHRVFDTILIKHSNHEMLKLHDNNYNGKNKYNELFINFEEFAKKSL